MSVLPHPSPSSLIVPTSSFTVAAPFDARIPTLKSTRVCGTFRSPVCSFAPSCFPEMWAFPECAAALWTALIVRANVGKLSGICVSFFDRCRWAVFQACPLLLQPFHHTSHGHGPQHPYFLLASTLARHIHFLPPRPRHTASATTNQVATPTLPAIRCRRQPHMPQQPYTLDLCKLTRPTATRQQRHWWAGGSHCGETAHRPYLRPIRSFRPCRWRSAACARARP
jgi:hypothetical protein